MRLVSERLVLLAVSISTTYKYTCNVCSFSVFLFYAPLHVYLHVYKGVKKLYKSMHVQNI